MMDFDFYIYEDEIKKIDTICQKHPISWIQILQALEAAIPLIDNIGPDALTIAVINEKLHRCIDDKI